MSIKNRIKQLLSKEYIAKYIYKNPMLIRCLVNTYNKTIGFNKFRKGKNLLLIKTTILHHCHFNILGQQNFIEIENLSYLNNCQIKITGDKNYVYIGEKCVLNDVFICIEGDSNTVNIGRLTTIYGKTELAAMEGTKISIGEDCMFSGEIHFRTGDSHSIVNSKGERINKSKDIIFGNHVWVGSKVICLKGTTVGSNCIIGMRSLLNSEFNEDHVMIAGIPSKMVKKEIDWKRERL